MWTTNKHVRQATGGRGQAAERGVGIEREKRTMYSKDKDTRGGRGGDATYLVPEGVVAATQGSVGAAAAAAGLGAAGAARGASPGLPFAPASGACGACGGRFCAAAPPRLEGVRGAVAARVCRPGGAHAPAVAVAVGDAPSLSLSLSLWAGPRGRLRPPASPTRT